MRGTTWRSWAAGLATVTLAAGLAACTSDSDGKDSPAKDSAAKSCTDGTYAWSGVRRWEKLTSLADPIRFEKKTEYYKALLKPTDDTIYRPTVTGAPAGVGAARVIKALGAHLKVKEPLAGPSETERIEKRYFERATSDPKGSYYSWGWIDLVEADFTYTCKGSTKPVKGHVSTWRGTGSGFLSCSDLSESTVGRAAARRTCPVGSPAANKTDTES
ncbi:hypothetical protein [Streptomyces sparsogenes]|uniref:Lipoprotein n=1 Tax=Streptomyces sparsogenes DSM 40356 TaxID=1331668 RepID=A0A1R1SGG2_9ACTN|nr:hypothetical protein [Streptomyces sparsogenes]OMI37298.1 hypothetical protein SPAR_21742 [Streptomyces sparsogenes DSM 40356]